MDKEENNIWPPIQPPMTLLDFVFGVAWIDLIINGEEDEREEENDEIY